MIKNYEPTKEALPTTTFSIIIPFKNEKNNLPSLLNSLEKINYPIHLFEVILVDDNSTDNYTLPLNKQINIQIIQHKAQTKASKKEAIQAGINRAKHQWIVTTDADCMVPKNWLQTLDSFIQEKIFKMVVMPVKYIAQQTFLYHFQNIEMISLQGVTKGSFGIKQAFMCNGANFAYTKDFFYELEGFDNQLHIASGDDVFLLQKALVKNTQFVGYLSSNEVVVETQAVKNWTELIQQKVRWASKTKAYKSIFSKVLALVVAASNIVCLASLLGYVCTQNNIFIVICMFKIFVDWLLLIQSNTFFKSKIRYLFLSSFFYPFFALFIFIKSINGKYYWKGIKTT